MVKSKSKQQSSPPALSEDTRQYIIDAVSLCATQRIQSEFNNLYTLLAVHVVSIEKQWHIEIGLDKTDNGYRDAIIASDIPGYPKITLKDCEAITRAIEEDIDALPILNDLPYRLDVSSPGVFRALTTVHECEFYLHWPVAYLADDSTQRIEGTIDSVDSEHHTANIITDNGKPLTVDINALQWLDGTPRLELNPPLNMPDDMPED